MTDETSLLEYRLKASLREGAKEHLKNALQICVGTRERARHFMSGDNLEGLLLDLNGIEARIEKALENLETK